MLNDKELKMLAPYEVVHQSDEHLILLKRTKWTLKSIIIDVLLMVIGIVFLFNELGYYVILSILGFALLLRVIDTRSPRKIELTPTKLTLYYKNINGSERRKELLREMILGIRPTPYRVRIKYSSVKVELTNNSTETVFTSILPESSNYVEHSILVADIFCRFLKVPTLPLAT